MDKLFTNHKNSLTKDSIGNIENKVTESLLDIVLACSKPDNSFHCETILIDIMELVIDRDQLISQFEISHSICVQ